MSPSVRLRASRGERNFRNPPTKDDVVLTGMIEGKDASDLEEYFYMGVRKQPEVQIIRFETVWGAPHTGMYGAIELDFLIKAFRWFAVQIDGDFVHKSSEERWIDYTNDQKLKGHLRSYGIDEVIRIPEKWVDDKAKGEQAAREVIKGRVKFDG